LLVLKSYTQIWVNCIITCGARCWYAVRNTWRLPCYR